jgi:hypothetical protein
MLKNKEKYRKYPIIFLELSVNYLLSCCHHPPRIVFGNGFFQLCFLCLWSAH